MLLVASVFGKDRCSLAVLRLYGWARTIQYIFFILAGTVYLGLKLATTLTTWDYMNDKNLKTNWNKTLIQEGYYVAYSVLVVGILMLCTAACFHYGRQDARSNLEEKRLEEKKLIDTYQ